jgi:arylsulfatase A-like enzyme
MRHNLPLRYFGALSLWLLAVMLLFSPYSQAQQNVVLVILDACREDCVDDSYNGIPLMPYLSSFPATRFRNARSTSSWTLPSMASLFTSTYVDTHQVHASDYALSESAETIGEYFKSAGYTTLGVQTNSNVTDEWGFSQGFDQYIYNHYAPSDWVTNTGLSLVENQTEPFFLFVHYIQPHVPYFPPLAYRTMMGYPHPVLTAAERSIIEDFNPYQRDFNMYHQGLSPALTFDQLSPIACDSVRALYNGDVRFNDDQLAILLNSVLADYPDTIVIVTADHGEHFWEHNALGHVITAYEQLLHIPLFIKAPGLPTTPVDTLVSIMDIMPTLANMLGLPQREHWEGQDMFGSRDVNAPVFATTKAAGLWLSNTSMIRRGNMKLIWEYKTGSAELYDTDTDPGELVDLKYTYPEICQELTVLLHKRLLQSAKINGWDSTISASPDQLLDEGQTVELTASAGTGHTWFRNGIPLTDSPSHISGSGTQTLVIQNVTIADRGYYECMYDDDQFHLDVTMPYIVNVKASEEMSAYSDYELMLLIMTLILLVLFRINLVNHGNTSAEQKEGA